MKQLHFTQEVLYAVAKLYAYWITVNYREAYGIYAATAFYLIMNQNDEVRLL